MEGKGIHTVDELNTCTEAQYKRWQPEPWIIQSSRRVQEEKCRAGKRKSRSSSSIT